MLRKNFKKIRKEDNKDKDQILQTAQLIKIYQNTKDDKIMQKDFKKQRKRE